MDTALYERGKQLLEEKLAKQKEGGKLGRLFSMEAANLPEISRREAFLNRREASSAKLPHHRSRPRPSSKRGNAQLTADSDLCA